VSKRQNILVVFLELLKVKHTKAFTSRFFNEHPHKYNLYGLSKMLSGYGVENAATRITTKEQDIGMVQIPFIAHFGRDFVAVHNVTPEEVSFLWRGLPHTLPMPKFVEACIFD